MADTRKLLKDFVRRFFRQREVEEDENFYLLGFANSLFVMQLAVFVEQKFSISLTPDEIMKLTTIAQLAEFIKKNKESTQ